MRKHEKTSASLMTVKQRSGESLRSYINRFNNEALEVHDLDPFVALATLMNGVTSTSFCFSLSERPPLSYTELLSRAENYINAEETILARTEADRRRIEEERRDKDKQTGGQGPSKRSCGDNGKSRDRRRSPQRFERYTPLITSQSNVLMEIKNRDYIRWPERMRTDGNKRDKGKYCEFHRGHGYDTKDCRQLKEEIEALIQRGYLKKYVDNGQKRRGEQ